MRVRLATIGSTGDVRPFVWMARTLKHAGHEAVLLAAEYFRPMIESYGVACHPLPLEMDPR